MAGRKPFLDASKSFLFVKCSLLMVLLFVIVVAVMGHRKFGIFKVLIYLAIGQHTWKSFVTASKHNFGIMSRTYNSGCFTILPRG